MSAFRSEYERQVAGRRIEYEVDQDPVVGALDRLSNDIADRKTVGDFFAGSAVAQAKGVYIWGKVGRGKSMLMNLFYDHVDESAKGRLHFHSFMQEVHRAMQPTGDGRQHEDPIAQASATLWDRIHLLCLDELEVVDIADAMIVGRLFDALFERGLVLVATSNEHPDNLYRDGPNRELFAPFVERLKQHVDVIQIGGVHDHRSDGDANAAAYLSPITIETQRRFEHLWQQVVTCRQERPASVAVHGRELHFDRCCGSNLRVTFDDVCKRPLSADDHLAIAERFKSIFLEGLPIISRDQVDEGRRLVTLIDALYESKARLVALAAAPANEIFDQVEAEDQRRTISRLNEMKNGRL